LPQYYLEIHTGNFCRVPLALRGAQQRITPDVQTGCISCASGDGKFGAPIWWNTPLDDEDIEAQAKEQHRTQWGQVSVILHLCQISSA
jgi:bud site selection protein 31